MRRAGRLAACAVVLLVLAGCSKSPTPGQAKATATTTAKSLPFQGSPSQAVLAEAAGLNFPASVSGYRSVRITGSELNVSFTIAAADVDAFVSGSHLGALTANKRIILHSSPVWDLNPTGTVQSALSARQGIERGIEVVTSATDPATDTVRLVVAKT